MVLDVLISQAVVVCHERDLLLEVLVLLRVSFTLRFFGGVLIIEVLSEALCLLWVFSIFINLDEFIIIWCGSLIFRLHSGVTSRSRLLKWITVGSNVCVGETLPGIHNEFKFQILNFAFTESPWLPAQQTKDGFGRIVSDEGESASEGSL
jgi:hypothetical protein